MNPLNHNIPNDSLRHSIMDSLGIEEAYATPEPSGFESFLLWIAELISDVLRLGFSDEGSIVSKIIIWSILAGLLYLIVKTGIPYFQRFRKKGNVVLEEGEDHELGTESLEQKLTLLENEKMHLEALRIRYLLMLRSLEERHIVAVAPSKTSRQYAREISEPSQRMAFQEITHEFNEIVFGRVEFDQQKYLNIANAMQEVCKK